VTTDLPAAAADLAARAAAAGFDLAAPFAIEPGDAPLPRFGRARALGVVVGNTRALWPRFAAAVAADPALAADPDPLDRYTEATLTAAAPAGAAVYFAHVAYAEGHVPVQALAARAGLAAIAPSGLCVHPTFGPWIALRAVVAIDAPPPPPRAPATLPCTCAAVCLAVRAELDRDGRRFDPASPTWTDWVRLREACPVGRAHRYGEAQLRYHYTRDRTLLPVVGPDRNRL
jgi:cyanocobalamin reductase (cyanide-eliminating) / alkylcobalamin dealkylase